MQAELYDFSRNAVKVGKGDIGIVSLLENDELSERQHEFLSSFIRHEGHSGVFLVSSGPSDEREKKVEADAVIRLSDPVFSNDPLLVRQHMGLKMLLNAHSTCVMARLGRLTGNTMTNVSPANLKLVGRATYLIIMHVNEHLAKAGHKLEYPQVCN